MNDLLKNKRDMTFKINKKRDKIEEKEQDEIGDGQRQTLSSLHNHFRSSFKKISILRQKKPIWE